MHNILSYHAIGTSLYNPPEFNIPSAFPCLCLVNPSSRFFFLLFHSRVILLCAMCSLVSHTTVGGLAQ